MNIIDIELDGWSTIVFKFNWLAVVFTLVLVLGISFLMKQCFNYVSKNIEYNVYGKPESHQIELMMSKKIRWQSTSL